MIDLRSDTVTRPTPAMRRAMAEAVVGDDAYGEDPTVNRLEAMAAECLGKERALFVPSGTMANAIAIALHAARGTEVICEQRAHVVEYELASMAVIAGCLARPVPTPDGILDADLVGKHLRPDLPGHPRPGLILIENTHNLASGAATPVDNIRGIARLARERGIPVHIDGARLFNAAAALGCTASDLAAPADSVSFCLSKGLCAPVGSLLAGTRAFIDEARRWRRRLGGGMRQAGVLAAAGCVAIESMRDRLVEDHDKARRLVEGIRGLEGWDLLLPPILTNIVYVRIAGPAGAPRAGRDGLRGAGVLCNTAGDDRIRFVTHHDVTPDDIGTAIEAIRRVAEATPRA